MAFAASSHQGHDHKHGKEAPWIRSCYPATALLASFWVVLTAVSFWAFLRDQQRSGAWGCEMSWMTPSYRQVTLAPPPHQPYSLYLYREQDWDPVVPSGHHPIIFVPGNAGSFKQVRSIASSASRQFYSAKENQGPTLDGQPIGGTLDFFTVDFNEEFSALHAATLREQAKFIAAAVPQVLATYRHLPLNSRPNRVTLLGHSMGGIVARLATTMMDPAVIDAIITMSTPHMLPPLAFEYDMERIYQTINAAAFIPLQPPLISICGGVSDTQIVSDSCVLPNELVKAGNGLTIFTTGIPGAWTGVEHQAIVWCHQVRWRIAKSLLEMSKSWSREGKLAIAKHWLVGPSTEIQRTQPSAHRDEFFLQRSRRITVTASSMSLVVKMVIATEYSLIDPPLRVRHCHGDDVCHERSMSVHPIPWMEDSEKPFPSLGEGVQLSDTAFIVNIEELVKGDGYLVVEAPALVEVWDGSHVSLKLDSMEWNSPNSTFAPSHLQLHFKKPLLSTMLAWRLDIRKGSCSGKPPVILHTSASFYADLNSSVELRYYAGETESMVLHSHMFGAPFLGRPQDGRGLDIHIFQTKFCAIQRVKLTIDLLASLAKAVIRFRIAAVTWCLGWVAVTLFQILRDFGNTGIIPSANKIIERNIGRNILTSFVGILGLLLLQRIAAICGIPAHQLSLGLTHPSLASFPLLTAVWSYGTVVIVQRFLSLAIHLSSQIFASEPKVVSENQRSVWSRIAWGCLLLLTVKLLIPYQMAFVILFVVQFSLTVRLAGADSVSRKNVLSISLLLVVFLLPFNAPSLAVWGRNIWVDRRRSFPNDHAVLPILPYLLFVEFYSVHQVKIPHKFVHHTCCAVTALLLCASFIVGPYRAFILPHLANLVFLSLCGLVIT